MRSIRGDEEREPIGTAAPEADLLALIQATRGSSGALAPLEESRPARTDPAYPVVVGTAETPVGFLSLAVTRRGVVGCSFDPEEVLTARLARVVSPEIGSRDSQLDPVRRELNGYFDGQLRSFSIPLDLRLLSDFGRAVLRTTLDVPYGSVTTHAALAKRIGRPGALRAVRNTLLTNPLCVFLPCHRAVSEDYPREVGEYAGGIAAKRYLLTLEELAE